MLLTITTTHRPATDLGYLLHKHPDRCQSFEMSFGQAHVFYPESTATRCTAALALDIDPVALARGKTRGASVEQYVNDRPYVASSYLSVAIADVFGSALAGRSRERPDLVNQQLPLEAQIAVIRCVEGEGLLRQVFEPLGYEVSAAQHNLDDHVPQWGKGPYFTFRLRGLCRLQDLLAHLYVLVPVLDDRKHYWVTEDETEKLLRRGGEWLACHPYRELITRRYLKHQRSLVEDALARLAGLEEGAGELEGLMHGQAEERLEAPLRLGDLRTRRMLECLRESGAKRVLDLGCGEGPLLLELAKEQAIQEIVGVDISQRTIESARRRLANDPHGWSGRLQVLHGSLTYRDLRLQGFDAAVLMEVIEHIDPSRLPALEDAVFGFARPRIVLITTPNAEYNSLFPGMPSGTLRHPDHRFEWTRDEFETWAGRVAAGYGYQAQGVPIGPTHPELGAPTQMAVFRR